MALDGFVISNLVYELNDKLLNGRINKIYQPEHDQLLLQVNNNRVTFRLFLSANATLPLVSLTEENKENPMTPPPFCMLLRKHLNNARIVEVSQPSLERIIRIKLEHLDELGDLSYKFLIVELMGRHSNIIFCNDKDMIIDSIKHVSHAVSSIREVLPGRQYFQPEEIEKLNPFLITYDDFEKKVLSKPMPVFKAIYSSITGFSPLLANELCYRASVDSSMSTSGLSEQERLGLFDSFKTLTSKLEEKDFVPNIIYKKDEPVEFSCIKLNIYEDLDSKEFSSISEVLETYYSSKILSNTIGQKSASLRKIVANATERASKKLDIQLKQYEDTKKREKFRIYGELINVYGYNVNPKDKEFKAINYYDGQEVVIPLDPNLSMAENAQKYFSKYNKLKRTYEALTIQIKETRDELDHLGSIKNALEIASNEADLNQIRKELMDYGYVRKRADGKKKKQRESKSKPYHYVSSDGFNMYVGKNNYQNDELTFKIASSDDWWFHAKEIPGSHVIVKTAGREITDSTIYEAARLAAYYSSGRESGKVEIDYTMKKHLNKPKGGKPGFVTYNTYKSMIVPTDIKDIEKVE